MSNQTERFHTVKSAAAQLGIQYWKLQRAVKSGAVPSYKIHNSRRMVLLSQVVAAITATSEEKASGEVAR